MATNGGLIGYPLRRAARFEMLYGGVRLANLVSEPSPLKLTKSQDVSLVTPKEEAELLGLEYGAIGQRLLPVNISQRTRVAMDVIRAKDVYRRFLEQNARSFVPPAKDLHVEPAGYVPGTQFLPLQFAKPMGALWSPTTRGGGVRSPRQQLFQERLDGKGFGWKKKARSLWQQDVDTNGFRPRRYF